MPALNVGTYTVTVALQGFKTAVLKDVTVTAGGPATVRATLEVGGLDRDRRRRRRDRGDPDAVGGRVDDDQHEARSPACRSASRSTLDFVQFLPGVQTPSSVRNSTVNGLPQSSINITLDGVNIQDNT